MQHNGDIFRGSRRFTVIFAPQFRESNGLRLEYLEWFTPQFRESNGLRLEYLEWFPSSDPVGDLVHRRFRFPEPNDKIDDQGCYCSLPLNELNSISIIQYE